MMPMLNIAQLQSQALSKRQIVKNWGGGAN